MCRVSECYRAAQSYPQDLLPGNRRLPRLPQRRIIVRERLVEVGDDDRATTLWLLMETARIDSKLFTKVASATCVGKGIRSQREPGADKSEQYSRYSDSPRPTATASVVIVNSTRVASESVEVVAVQARYAFTKA